MTPLASDQPNAVESGGFPSPEPMNEACSV